MKHYVAIDLGAESGRVMLGGVSDAGISLEEVHRFANVPVRAVEDGAETLRWNVRELWRGILAGLQKIAEGKKEIAGIGIDTWGVDFGMLDAAGELLGNPFCYRDGRTAGMAEEVFRRIPRERLYGITGIQTLPINSLFQMASMSAGGRSGARELAEAKRILFMPDLLMYWMTGRMGTEYTIASTSQMMDAQTGRFSAEIFSAIGVDSALFPEIERPAERGSVRGTVMKSVNETLAAAKVPVMVVGEHDTASAVAAVPAAGGQEDWLYLSSGTWSLLGAEVDGPVLSEKAAACDMTNEGGVGGKIRLLKNIAGMWLVQECSRAWAAEGKARDYTGLTKLAREAKGTGAVLDLSDAAFFAPGEMPAKIAAHCRGRGYKVPESEGEYVRLVLESLAARYAEVVGELSELTGRRFRRLHVVGGGSRNDLLNQLAADATRLEVVAGPVEATAMGNIVAQAITTGEIGSLAEGRELVARSAAVRVFRPARNH